MKFTQKSNNISNTGGILSFYFVCIWSAGIKSYSNALRWTECDKWGMSSEGFSSW